MSSSNPSVTASDIITDVENRLLNPNISGTIYLPWISYAYQKLYQALVGAGDDVSERFFGVATTFNLTPGTGEYSLNSNIPRFGGFIKVELKYGATGNDWNRADRLDSVAHWRISNNTSTSYRGKDNPLYYIIGDTIGFIPIPPASENAQTPQAKVYHLNRPYQITLTGDIIDIPYRFIYPIANYVQARAIERENEDYATAQAVESKFQSELELVAQAAASEYGETEETNAVQVSTNSELFSDPLNF